MSTTTSVLRYPGGKTRFAPFIEETLSLNGINNALFVEPFCGGASVSISLLERGIVRKIALNDSDPLISSLWKVIFSEDSEWLANQVLNVPLTLDEWKRQKTLQPTTVTEMALKCLYLNRTSFNGIIHKAGPLGGWGQTNRTVGVRFNREKLASRIRELAELQDQVVAVECLDWRKFCAKMKQRKNAIFYFDPPYFHKAELLYGHYFQLKQHLVFKKYLNKLDVPWILSYDDATEIRALYGALDLSARVIDSTYSAHPMGGASFVGRELFFSNLDYLPLPKTAKGGHSGLSVRSYTELAEDVEGVTRIPLTEAASQRISY